MHDRPIRTAVLISGSGRTLANLLEESARGELPIDIVLVISSRPDVRGVEIARQAGIETCIIARRDYPEPAFSERISATLDAVGVELVLLAGYLCKWEIPPRYEGKVLNIHPALLPRFGGKGMHGLHVHEAVLAAGEKISGCTVHYANNEYDAGPILLQRVVPILPGDTPETLAARVFEQECIAYPDAIRLHLARQACRAGRRDPGSPEAK